jgi:hypothetical protein
MNSHRWPYDRSQVAAWSLSPVAILIIGVCCLILRSLGTL